VSRDVIALVTTAPNAPAIAAAMVAAGEDLLVVPHADGAVVQLCDSPGGRLRPLLTIEEPILVAVPGEVARLLGSDVADQVQPPLWWIEVRVPAEPENAIDIGYRFADEMVRRLGGTVWPRRL
jgi:hypothetical protein